METSVTFTGINTAALEAVMASGVDHGGNPINRFVDHKGGWPLRCCLSDSEPGDEIAIIAWSPFEWDGPYRETGPIVVHANPCRGRADDRELPAALDRSAMVLRPYGHDRMIAYHRVRHVAEGRSVSAEITAMLAEPDVDFVHGRNVTGGCYSFTARRA